MAVLAIDYDGVIVDSDLKSLFIAYNAYNRIQEEKNNYFFGTRFLTFNNWEDVFKKYTEEIKIYKRLRCYVKNANDYLLIIELIKNRVAVYSQDDFYYIKKELGFDNEIFFNEFYKEKERIHELDFLEASKLEPIHSEVLEGMIKFIYEGIDIYIITLNRKKDVLKYLNFNYPFVGGSIKDIYDISFGENKVQQIKYLANNNSIDFNKIFFIDDQISHLIQTKILGINLFLANWGYVSDEQRKQAINNDIHIIESGKNFYKDLKYFMGNSLEINKYFNKG